MSLVLCYDARKIFIRIWSVDKTKKILKTFNENMQFNYNTMMRTSFARLSLKAD